MSLNELQGHLDLYQNIEFKVSNIISSFNLIGSYMSNIKVFSDAVSKTALNSLGPLNLILKRYIQLDLPQHHSQFHPDQLKRVGQNEAKSFCFVLNL